MVADGSKPGRWAAPGALRPAEAWGAAAIVAAAAALRLWNIGSGIPYNVGQDEPQVMHRVVHMMKTGDFNPHFFDWPTLTFYLNLIVASLAFLAGAMRGLWSSLDQVSAPELYLTGRQFTALVGAATVGLTFAAARRWGTGVALVAAALMAVVPGHVRESHYVLTDVPTAFFTTLTLLLALRAQEQQTTRAIAWAAASAGLAASCKYNGSMAVLLPLIVVWTGRGGMGVAVRRTLVVAGVFAAAFLAGTPYAVLDLPAFLNDYARLAATFARERPGDPGWSIYLKQLIGGLAWPAFAAVVAGALLMVWRLLAGPERARALLLVAFTAVYFTVMARSYQIYGRYLLPLYPFICLFAAVAVMRLAAWLRPATPSLTRRLAAAALVVAVLAPPTLGAISFSRGLGRPSTIDLAYQWITANVAANTKVAIEAGALHLPPTHQTYGLGSLLERSLDDYRREGVTYLLAASPAFQAALADPRSAGDAAVGYRRLLSQTIEVAAFDSGPGVPGPTLRLYRIPQ